MHEERRCLRFLVVEDDEAMRAAITTLLQVGWAGCEEVEAVDGEQALECFTRADPDLVILDLGLPKRSGIEVLQAMRQTSDVPVLVLTGWEGEIPQARLLSLGADDYVVKPISLMVLQARIRALLRRTDALPRSVSANVREIGDVRIDLGRQLVTVRGEPIRLSATEQRVLFYLARHHGHLLSYRELLDHVWGVEYGATREYLKVFISRLRSKLEPDPEHRRLIENEHGIGYRLIPSTELSPVPK